MNPKKLEEYKVTGSIHTLQVSVPYPINEDYIDPIVDSCIDITSKKRKDGTVESMIKINPNKLKGEVLNYMALKSTLESINSELNVENPMIVRADMRFDSYDQNHFIKYTKLNRFLISLVADTYQVKNCYASEDLFTSRKLSMAIKNRDFELECYDKDAESSGKDPAKSRLEERSKTRIESIDLRYEFLKHWKTRWDKSLEHFDNVQKRYNDALEQIYMDNKDVSPVQFRTVTDFLIHYQYCIFTKKQMIDLLMRITGKDHDQCKRQAENHKARYGIEYFSKKDVRKAVDEIMRATAEFFES